MGWTRHHAIVVTAWGEGIFAARDDIARLASAGIAVSGVTRLTTNGYQSFLVAPDGSNELWHASDAGDACRAQIKDYLRSLAYDDGSTRFAWVEVQFGDDEELETIIVNDSDKSRREAEAEEGR
jgi:hypothetical protein